MAALAQVLLFGGLVLFVVTGFPGLKSAVTPATRSAAAAAPVTGELPRATVDRFDAPAALGLVARQVAMGQRPAGSPALRKTAELLRPLLPNGRFEDLPLHPGLRNVVGVLPGRRPAIVIGAHYDTESHPKGFVGANDSAAGTAALIGVAKALRGETRPKNARELRFVLFDGEEEPKASDNRDFYRYALRGSKAYVAAHRGQVRAMILLDYIANKGLSIPREGTSDRGLWGRLRTAAAAVGVGSVFPQGTGTPLFDDTTPFLRAGIPSIDLIDFTYRYADGLQDTPDKLDVRAMDATGESVVELVRRLDAAGY